MKIHSLATALTGAFTAALVLAGAATAGEVMKWNLASPNPSISLSGETGHLFCKLLKERSGGKLDVTPHYGAALGYKGRDQYSAIEDGAIEFASTAFDKIVGLDPIYELQSLPFLTPTIQQTKAMFESAKPYYEKAFNKANQTLLYGAPWTPQGIWAKKRIKSVADLKHLKMRTYDVTGLKTFKRAGASPIQLSWPDVVPGLSTNTIEAVLTSDESGVNGRFWEYGVKYFNFLGYTMGISALTMNRDLFNSLSKEQQDQIRSAAKEAEDWAWAGVHDRVKHNKKIMADAGAEFISDVPQEVIDHLKKAGEPLLGEWKKKMGPDSEKILADFKKRVGM